MSLFVLCVVCFLYKGKGFKQLLSPRLWSISQSVSGVCLMLLSQKKSSVSIKNALVFLRHFFDSPRRILGKNGFLSEKCWREVGTVPKVGSTKLHVTRVLLMPYLRSTLVKYLFKTRLNFADFFFFATTHKKESITYKNKNAPKSV